MFREGLKSFAGYIGIVRVDENQSGTWLTLLLDYAPRHFFVYCVPHDVFEFKKHLDTGTHFAAWSQPETIGTEEPNWRMENNNMPLENHFANDARDSLNNEQLLL